MCSFDFYGFCAYAHSGLLFSGQDSETKFFSSKTTEGCIVKIDRLIYKENDCQLQPWWSWLWRVSEEGMCFSVSAVCSLAHFSWRFRQFTLHGKLDWAASPNPHFHTHTHTSPITCIYTVCNMHECSCMFEFTCAHVYVKSSGQVIEYARVERHCAIKRHIDKMTRAHSLCPFPQLT